MRTSVTAAAALLLAALAAVPARAGAPVLAEEPCSAMTAPPSDDTTTTFVMWGGPVVASTASTADPVSVTLTCTYQRSGTRHVDPDTYAVSATGTAAAVLAPTTFEAEWGFEDFPVLCTEVTTVDAAGRSTTQYWDADVDEWSGDSASNCQFWEVACPALDGRRDNQCEGGEPFDPFVSIVDPAICPVLAGQYPPDGDVESLWDCPPYGS
jgi:hypothetical protein